MDEYHTKFPCPSIQVADVQLQDQLQYIDEAALESGWESIDQLEKSSQNVGRSRYAVLGYQQNNFSHKWFSSKTLCLESSISKFDTCLHTMEERIMGSLGTIESSLQVAHKDYVKCKYLRNQRRALVEEGIQLDKIAVEAGAQRLYVEDFQKIKDAEDNAKRLYLEIDSIFQEVQMAGKYQRPIDHLEEQLTKLQEESLLKRCKLNFPEGVEIVSRVKRTIKDEMMAWRKYLEAALLMLES